MADYDELKRTVEYALRGAPDLKAHEKRKWLGEFRERVIMGIPLTQVNEEETLDHVKNALENTDAHLLIVNNLIPIEGQGRYMRLAKGMNKEYKTVSSEAKEAMGIVVASTRPVDYADVIPRIQSIPEKFVNSTTHRLCNKHFQELKTISPRYAQKFKGISFMDKLLGVGCSACHWEKKEGEK